VEGEGRAKKSSRPSSRGGISDEFSWLKDTRWNWNNWREVIFRSDGSFLAPAENCENTGNPNCRWSADEDRITIKCARRPVHGDTGRQPALLALPCAPTLRSA